MKNDHRSKFSNLSNLLRWVVEGLPYKPKYWANICYSLFYILILFLTLFLAVKIRSLFINYPTTAGTLAGQRQRQQNGEAFFRKYSWGAHFFPMFPSFQYRKHCFQCQLLFPRCKCLRYTKGNFKENPSIRAVAKILRARASDQFFASNSSKGQILRALSNWMGPFDSPKVGSRIGWCQRLPSLKL